MVFLQYVFQHVYMTLPGLHAFTGSDTTATFFNEGMKKAQDTWCVFPAAIYFFNMLSSPITDEMELGSCEKVLHEFVNRLYGLVSVGQSVYQGPNQDENYLGIPKYPQKFWLPLKIFSHLSSRFFFIKTAYPFFNRTKLTMPDLPVLLTIFKYGLLCFVAKNSANMIPLMNIYIIHFLFLIEKNIYI